MQSIALKDILKQFPKRPQDSHKGTFGHILNISGSKSYTGAAILSSLSALKIGAGYVTLATVEDVANIVHSYTPDIPTISLKQTANGTISRDNTISVTNRSQKFDVISIGSGLGKNEETTKFVADFVTQNQKPIVIDADGLNSISNSEIDKISGKSIITPHPKELSRLIKVPVEIIQSDREYYAVETAKSLETIVVLKGHNTIVTDGEQIYINKSGCSALAKAGSGDVLTGMITGLLAQTKNPLNSAILGVFLHGLTGDIAAKSLTEYGVLASDLLNFIPKAIKEIL